MYGPTLADATTMEYGHPLPTGFEDLDALTSGGLRPRTLTIIASRPGIGRTTLLTDICRRNVLRDATPTALWTLEESRPDIFVRFLSAEARVARHALQSDLVDPAGWERVAQRVQEFQAAPMMVDAPASATVSDIASRASDLVTQHGVRLLAIDGLQGIRPDKRNDLREREVGDVVRDLKTLARELNVAIMATAHLNRGPEHRISKRPRLDDLRESGAITFAADLIILVHREDAYERESPRAGEADLIVAKHRSGPEATVTVAFQPHYSRFVEMAQGEATAPEPATTPVSRFGVSNLFQTPCPTPPFEDGE